jgi:hypothetical protein
MSSSQLAARGFRVVAWRADVRAIGLQPDSQSAAPSLELLLGETFVTTAYGDWDEGQPPYIVSLRIGMTLVDQAAHRKPI